MRYVINDDDLESWRDYLKLALETIPQSIELKYVLEEIELHINNPLAFKIEEKIEQENTRLRTMLFHFTGKME